MSDTARRLGAVLADPTPQPQLDPALARIQARCLERSRAPHEDGSIPPPAWWSEPNVQRTLEFASLTMYGRVFAPEAELSVDDVLANPLAFDELFRQWRVCERCVRTNAPRCPQRLIKGHLYGAYVTLRRIGKQWVFVARECRDQDQRHRELCEAWGVASLYGATPAAPTQQPTHPTRGDA